MKRNKKRKTKEEALVLLWILTAVAALLVTLLYLKKLSGLYDDLGSGDPAQSALDKIHSSQAIGQMIEERENRSDEDVSTDDSADITDKNEAGIPADIGTPAGEPADQETAGNDDGQSVAGTDTASGEDDPGESGDTATVTPEVTPQPTPTREPWRTTDAGNIDPKKPIIALSFDDGPGMYTARIIETLQKYGCKATFFMVGYNVKYHAKNVKAVYDAGMEIGNHTLDHTELTKIEESKIAAEILENEEQINAIVNVGELVVRPPFGSYNDRTKELVDRPMFNWTIDSEDWKDRDKYSKEEITAGVVKRVKAQAHDGYIILMHEIYESSADAVDELIPWLVEQGYQVTTVSEMFAARNTELERGQVYRFTETASAR